jgi:small subunit ribosomal protein S14|tara:strand:+ start:616 stop:921 length:306 start_codon:yes stop_codon:yes gene_type:complete
MATIRMKARNHHQEQLIARGRDKRDALRKQMKDPNLSLDEKLKISEQLQKRARDESPTRLSMRCSNCGRVHGVYRRFKLCRICIRENIALGYLPGVTLDSW